MARAPRRRRNVDVRFRIGQVLWVSTQTIIFLFIVTGLVFDNHLLDEHLLCHEDEISTSQSLPRVPPISKKSLSKNRFKIKGHSLREKLESIHAKPAMRDVPAVVDSMRQPPRSGFIDTQEIRGGTVGKPASNSLIADGSTVKVWRDSETLPTWMKAYFEWHTRERDALSKENWHLKKYLVMRCHADKDERCGGTSDRLNPLPLFALAAARTQRLLLISWTRPCPLENFLIAHPGGVNWTTPDWLTEKFEDRSTSQTFLIRADQIVNFPPAAAQKTLVYARMQTLQGSRALYDEEERDTPEAYRKVFRDVFRSFFTPAPPVAELIQHELGRAGLVPGEYAAAHHRALYGGEKTSNSSIALRSVNAVNCASMLRPGGPIFFSSDSQVASTAVTKYAEDTNRQVIVIRNEDSPLHLDKVVDWSTRKPSDFYQTFVDLFILGSSRCMVHSQGGFGRFALLISYDAFCSIKLPRNCGWKDADGSSVQV